MSECILCAFIRKVREIWRLQLLGDSACIRETLGRVGIVVPWVLPEGLLGFLSVSHAPRAGGVRPSKRSEAFRFRQLHAKQNLWYPW